MEIKIEYEFQLHPIASCRKPSKAFSLISEKHFPQSVDSSFVASSETRNWLGKWPWHRSSLNASPHDAFHHPRRIGDDEDDTYYTQNDGRRWLSVQRTTAEESYRSRRRRPWVSVWGRIWMYDGTMANTRGLLSEAKTFGCGGALLPPPQPHPPPDKVSSLTITQLAARFVGCTVYLFIFIPYVFSVLFSSFPPTTTNIKHRQWHWHSMAAVVRSKGCLPL